MADHGKQGPSGGEVLGWLGYLGYLGGLLLAVSIFLAADHVGHHSDTLGVPAEIVLFIALAILGTLIGRAAGRRDA